MLINLSGELERRLGDEQLLLCTEFDNPSPGEQNLETLHGHEETFLGVHTYRAHSTELVSWEAYGATLKACLQLHLAF